MLWIQKRNTPAQMRREVARIKSMPEWKKILEGDSRAIRENGFDLLSKDIIRRSLLEEQHGLCAYCMKRLKDDGRHTTIEHLVPLSRDKEKSLDYRNMAAVCKGGADVELQEGESRVLCCDGSKEDEEELSLSPYSHKMMDEICYHKDGRIYFRGRGEWTKEQKNRIEMEINQILCLNGRLYEDGSMREDTATMLVKGRKDAYKNAEKILERLAAKNKLTSSHLESVIKRLEDAQERQEFAGVLLFVLKRKKRRMENA